MATLSSDGKGANPIIGTSRETPFPLPTTKPTAPLSPGPMKKRPHMVLLTFIRSWCMLFIHLLFTAIFTYSLLRQIQGLHVNASNSQPGSGGGRPWQLLTSTADNSSLTYYEGNNWLVPGDVTTLVSVGLLFIKLTTSAWASVTAWRCAYIILEKESLTLGELNFLVAYKLCYARGWASWFALLTLLLVVPAQLSAPLASGAVSWQQSMIFREAVKEVQVYPSYGGDPEEWREYLADKEQREMVVDQAVSYTWNLYHDSVGKEDTGCRRPMSNTNLLEHSEVSNVTIPCLRVHSIQWYDALPAKTVLDAVTGPYLGVLEESENPITHRVPGNVGILDIPVWDGEKKYGSAPPEKRISSGTHEVAYLFQVESVNGFCTDLYGYGSKVYEVSRDVGKGCYTFAKVNFTAGTTTSGARVVTLGVLESRPDEPIGPNEFTDEAIALLNNVMHNMALSSPGASVSNRTLEVGEALLRGYVGAWNALQFNYGDNGGNRRREDLLPAGARQRLNLLQAVVTVWRVWVWVGLNLLMTLSGVLLFVLQWQCQREAPMGLAEEAIMIDSLAVREAAASSRKGDPPVRVHLAVEGGSDEYHRLTPVRE